MHTKLHVQIRRVLLGFMLGGIALLLCLGVIWSTVSRAQEMSVGHEPTSVAVRMKAHW